MVHPAAREFGIASLLVKVMMLYAIKESGRDAPDEQYLAHVVDGNGGPSTRCWRPDLLGRTQPNKSALVSQFRRCRLLS